MTTNDVADLCGALRALASQVAIVEEQCRAAQLASAAALLREALGKVHLAEDITNMPPVPPAPPAFTPSGRGLTTHFLRNG